MKLVGDASWDIARYLDDELWLPFKEPMILRHGFEVSGDDVPNFLHESVEENLRLAKLWSAKGLLALFDREPPGQLPAGLSSSKIWPQVKKHERSKSWAQKKQKK